MEQRRVQEMELKTSSCSSYGDDDDDDFIDMELFSATSPRFSFSAMQSRDFEFQMGIPTHGKVATTCPADELFYKGKLLPLHLPPRIQMVEKLIHSPSFELDGVKGGLGDQQYRNPLFRNSTAPCTNSNIPLDVSPSESCRPSSELNPDEYLFDWSTEISSLIPKDAHNYFHHLYLRKSLSSKIQHSSLGKKLKASRTYLKSLFSKSVCSSESCKKATCNAEDEPGRDLKPEECVNKYIKVVTKKKPVGSLQHEKFNISTLLLKNKEMGDDGQRKSFSGAINWNSATKKCSSTSSGSSSSSSSSSSFSFNFNGFYESQLLKNTNSSNSELDGSVEGAIAHCKQSQKTLPSTKKASIAHLKSFSSR